MRGTQEDDVIASVGCILSCILLIFRGNIIIVREVRLD